MQPSRGFSWLRYVALIGGAVAFASACGSSTTSSSDMDGSVPDMDAGPRERPENLPPPFATGTGEKTVMLDEGGCLDPEENVEISTNENITVELDDDTCFRTTDGEPITGGVTVRIDDAGGIEAQGSPGFLQGVIRLRVDLPSAGEDFLFMERDPEIRIELDDGGLGGVWEAVTYAEGAFYVGGPSMSGEREELVVTAIPIDPEPDGREEFSFFGAGPVAIRYTPPPEVADGAPTSAVPKGPGLNKVTTELLNAGLSAGFEQQHPHLCSWQAVSPETAEVLAVFTSITASTTPHGQAAVTGDYQGKVVLGPTPTFEVESMYYNRLVLGGFVCDETTMGVSAPFLEPGISDGGSEDEAFLPGPYDGRIVMRLSGPNSSTPLTIARQMSTWFSAPLRPVIRRFSTDGDWFEMILDMYGHQESVRGLESIAPAGWRFDGFDDRRVDVVTDELFFDFHRGEQGWLKGSIGVDGWGEATRVDRNNGAFKLDGTDSNDNTNPNAFISREITVPSGATKLDFAVSAHDRSGADAMYRVRLEDSNGASHVLRDWTQKTGIEGSLTFSSESVSISAFRGQTVTLFMEQDANAPGSHEQIYYDNIWIH